MPVAWWISARLLWAWSSQDLHPVGAGNPVTSCGLHVFVDEAAEPVSS
jgi:hypothetical protein